MASVFKAISGVTQAQVYTLQLPPPRFDFGKIEHVVEQL
jgi:hypothetical protein